MSSAEGWLQLARISNTPTVVSNSVAGAVLASTTAEPGPVAVVAGAMALFYTAGMILNDVLDYEIDLRERPERPLPSGTVSRPAALTAVIVLFAAGEALLLLEGTEPFLAGLGLIALIALYDAWHKGNPFSPVLMGACRALVYFVAALAVTASVPTEVATASASNSATPAIRLTTPCPIRRGPRTSHSARHTHAANAMSSTTIHTESTQPTQ